MDNIQQYKGFGIVFDGYSKEISADMALDSALLTETNAGVPVALTTYVDPVIIDILTAPLRARAIATERKMGDWTTSFAQFTMVEKTGFTQPYDDYADNGVADINANFPVRQNYVFETVIGYGDKEVETAGKAKLDLISRKQQSAANTLDMAMNDFYFYGVSGLANYGILNEPNLPTALTPANVGTEEAPKTKWADKTAQQIYSDILAMVTDIATRSQGIIDSNSKFKLVVSPAINSRLLDSPSQMLTTVIATVKGAIPNLEVVVAPQMSTNAGELVQLWAEVVSSNGNSNKTMELAFSEKMRAGRVIPSLSHFKQKFTAGTFGAVIYQPYAVSQMLGV